MITSPALVREIFAEPSPGAFAFLIAVPLVLLHAKDPATQELQGHLATLKPGPLNSELERLLASVATRS